MNQFRPAQNVLLRRLKQRSLALCFCVVGLSFVGGIQIVPKPKPVTVPKQEPQMPSQSRPNLQATLRKIERRKDIYLRPTTQDEEGRGIFPTPDQQDMRSEEVYPPFVLGPRRQTDSLVRQVYKLLPASVRTTTSFVITDRLMQNPKAYLEYLATRPNVVVVGSFMGLGEADFENSWVKEQHEQELWKLQTSIELLQAMGRNIKAVVFTMGDSPSKAGPSSRAALQQRMYEILKNAGLSRLQQPVTWGADEGVYLGFAQVLAPVKVKIRISNPESRHYYDGKRTSREVVAEKLAALGLIPTDGEDYDIEAAILTRVPGSDPDDFQANDENQREFDRKFLEPYQSYSEEKRKRLVILDGRLYNGAWDAFAAPQTCDILAFGGWGTFGNLVGATLATAKVLLQANNPLAQKQLFLEAVAHDVFANGYEEAQRGALVTKLADAGVKFDHFEGYAEEKTVSKVFSILNEHVNTRMQQHFASSHCLEDHTMRSVPQLWRTFESEMHLVPAFDERIAVPGVFRRDLVFSASTLSQKMFGLPELIKEATEHD